MNPIRRLLTWSACALERGLILGLGTVALVFGADVGGAIPPVTGRLLGLASLLAMSLVLSFAAKFSLRAALVFVLGCGLSLTGMDPVVWLGAFALAFTGLALVEGPNRDDLHCLALAGLVAAICITGARSVPVSSLWLNGLSVGLTELFGAASGTPLRLGPSTSGLWPLLVVAGVVAAQARIRRPERLRIVLALGFLTLAFLGFLTIQTNVPTGRPDGAYALVRRVWLAGVFAIPAVWLLAVPPVRLRGVRSRRTLAGAAAVLAGILFALIWSPAPRTGEAKIVLLDDGFVDWKVPEFGRYGPMELGLFGMLPEYLGLAGFESKRRPAPVTDAILSAQQILVVINPQKQWPAAELDAIWSHVRRGGGLLVLGDHTDLVGTQKSLNQLLRPAGISFRFDSGFPCRERWWHGLAALSHPIASHARAEQDAVISVGATLDLASPAYPVILGRYGFSDLGNRLNEQGAFLGDYIYQHGELMGDVVLVAAAQVGAGRVVVFGDTSPLQNGALPYSFEALVVPLFRWLSDAGAGHPPGGAGLGLVALALGLVLWLVDGDKVNLAVTSATVVLMALLAAPLSRGEPASLDGPVAWVDLSHHQRVALASNEDDGIGGALTNLVRNGYLPLIMRRFDPERVAEGEVFLTVAPTGSFKTSEIDALERLANAGGLVIVAAGWIDAFGSESLLERFGVEITPVPLGPVPVVRSDPMSMLSQPSFVEAWALRARPGPLGTTDDVTFVPSDLESPDTPEGLGADGASRTGFTRVFYEADGFTIVGYRKLGRGGLLAIGDSSFLTDANLENLRFHREGNILFLRDVLDQVRREEL